MNPYEIKLIERKKKECSDFIKAQHRLPKVKRDIKRLAKIKKELATYTKWLKDD